MMRDHDRRPNPQVYDLFMLALCLYALAALAIAATVELEPRTQTIVDYADYVVCGFFFLDFLVTLVRSEDRWRYLAVWGWLDLLSSIPTVDAARLGRLGRVLRICRVIRGVRAARLLAALILRRRAESAALVASLMALLLVVSCSIAILHCEVESESNIRTAEDALWWAFATITTVGYGDRYPVTTEGRMVAAVLMCAGVGLFGTLSACMAAWFIGPEPTAEDSRLRMEMAALRDELAQLRGALVRTGRDEFRADE